MQNSVSKELKNMVTDMMQGMHTCIPGKIKSFDASKCQASITPTGKFKKPNGEYMDYPDCTEVPVVLLQASGQDATIAYPIKEDDGCLIFFSEQQLDTWRDGSDPKTDLRFDLSNAICVCGVFTSNNSVVQEACDNNAIIIDKEDTRLTVKKDQIEAKLQGTTLTIEDGTATIKSDTIKFDGNVEVTQNVAVQGDITADGNIMAGIISLLSHTHLCTAPGSPTEGTFP